MLRTGGKSDLLKGLTGAISALPRIVGRAETRSCFCLTTELREKQESCHGYLFRSVLLVLLKVDAAARVVVLNAVRSSERRRVHISLLAP